MLNRTKVPIPTKFSLLSRLLNGGSTLLKLPISCLLLSESPTNCDAILFGSPNTFLWNNLRTLQLLEMRPIAHLGYLSEFVIGPQEPK
jgi:hypothetical protein